MRAPGNRLYALYRTIAVSCPVTSRYTAAGVQVVVRAAVGKLHRTLGPWLYRWIARRHDLRHRVCCLRMLYESVPSRARPHARVSSCASPKSLLLFALLDRQLYDGCARHFRLWPQLIRSDGNALAGVLHIDESTCLDLEYLERRLCS